MPGSSGGAGAEVRRLRGERGLTLAQLGEACGVTKAFVGQIETGTRVGFGPDMLFKLSHALGVGCDHWRPYFAPDLPPGDSPPDPPPKRPRGRPKKATAEPRLEPADALPPPPPVTPPPSPPRASPMAVPMAVPPPKPKKPRDFNTGTLGGWRSG